MVSAGNPPVNLFVSNVPGPQLPLYVGGATVEGIYPASAITDFTGALNITLFSYNGALDFGLIACREVVPDVWNLISYLREALDELLGACGRLSAPGGARHAVDEDRPQLAGHVVAHAGDQHQFGTRDGARSRATA